MTRKDDSIKRYWVGVDGFDGLKETASKDGEYVKYDDHRKALLQVEREVWDLVIDELQDRWDIESPYLDERVRILRDWCQQQKEAL